MITRPAVAVLFPVLLLFAPLGGCASQVVQTSVTRPPTSPADVKIYTQAPNKYEVLGVVEVPVGGDVHWDDRGDATAGFERMKAAAAARGANGLLLSDPAASTPKSRSDEMLVLAGYHGKNYHVPVRRGKPAVAVGQAIYVHEP